MIAALNAEQVLSSQIAFMIVPSVLVRHVGSKRIDMRHLIRRP
jgi:hypothetical protein